MEKNKAPKKTFNDFIKETISFFKSIKFQKIFYPTLYFALAIGVIVTGCFVFERRYYTNVYVSGSSMSPTLLGGENGRYHYGISDNHRKTIKTLERFDVVVTYYPEGWNSDNSYKIKRVWGFPNETITMSFSSETYNFTAQIGDRVVYTIDANVEDIGLGYKVATFETARRTFHTHATSNTGYLRTDFTITLKDNEYFIMGDNWSSSSDSYTHLSNSKKITFDLIQGKMVAIQGTARIKDGELYDKQKIKNLYYF